ncbi:MBL fold metallo-hydrolase [Stenotrophomonas maltophilia]|uniref:MBL fold metallo-hydrolase n=1 Tax=Stenotrophomonas maltophilia TaxID=40324 RepID=UPI00117DA626|nr:MBL fold metallo-hydrolase [Stenotrophomonas maltophilia]
MADSIELDFLAVETSKSGDAIGVRYELNGRTRIHVVDGGYLETGDRLVEHIAKHYGTAKVDSVVLTHPDSDHANGLRKVLERCEVGELWMHRPWLYAEELLRVHPRFHGHLREGRSRP